MKIYVLSNDTLFGRMLMLEIKAMRKNYTVELNNYDHSDKDALVVLDLDSPYASGAIETENIIGFSKNGDKIFELNVRDEIIDIAIGKNKIFALGEHYVFEFDKNENGEYVQSGIKAINEKFTHVVSDTSDNCYICTASTVTQVDFQSEKENV